ncbi:adaptin N terminal region-domain-containing protein, partial [Baffinella frigidus]
MSREFNDLVRAIGDCKSKQEEDSIIKREVVTLRTRLNERDAQGKMREFCMRMMYCEMLGHPVEFGYIHAVNMSQRTVLHEKKTGYLASSLFLDADSELLILLVNTLQRDLRSANPWEVCAALSAATKLIGADTVPAVIKMVKDVFAHNDAHVRKKALMALHRFMSTSPEAVTDCMDQFKRSLTDRDPSVMSAGLNGLFELAKANPRSYAGLVPSLVSILKQVIEHRLPRDYDYHKMPAPWLQVETTLKCERVVQIKLLKILASLGHANQKASEEMYEVLRDVMSARGSNEALKTTIGYAVIFECVKTVTRIYPQPQLLAMAAENTSRFITSDNRNLRYIGVDALSAIVQVNPDYAAKHQLLVIECLEDPDETLRRKTLDLLFRMTNSANVEVVVDRLTFFLSDTPDHHLKRDLVGKITTLAEKYAPSNAWYIHTMNSVFDKGGDLVDVDVAHNLMRLLAEGPTEDDTHDNELRLYAAQSYFVLLPKPNTSDRLIQVGSWCLGEYAYLMAPHTPVEDIVALLCSLLRRSHFKDPRTKDFLIVALTKMAPLVGAAAPGGVAVAKQLSASRATGLQQRCIEYAALVQRPNLAKRVLPLDASCEDIEVDARLPSLDAFVAASHTRRYMDPVERAAAFGISSTDTAAARSRPTANPEPQLRFEAYEKAEAPPPRAAALPPAHSPPPPQAVPEHAARNAAASALFAGIGGASPAAAAAMAPATPEPAAAAPPPVQAEPEKGLGLGGGKGKWGSEGYSGVKSQAPPMEAQGAA